MPATHNHESLPGDTVTDGAGAHDPAAEDVGPESGPALVSAKFALIVLVGLLLIATVIGYALSQAISGRDERRIAELDAIESWRADVRSSPEDVRTRLGLADALQASGRLSTALIEYEKILLEYPYDVAALYGRGTVLMKLGRPKDAETALLAVLAQDKGHVRAAEDLGDYYAGLKQYRDVLEAVRPAVQIHPTEARLQYLTGLAYENLGHRDWALARYRLALAAVPDMPEALQGVQRLQDVR